MVSDAGGSPTDVSPVPFVPPTAGRFRALLVAALASALLVTALPGAVAAQQTATQRYLI
ncbi:hypothetical protein BH20CHL5_BH20CHL5_11810 [soil metagenome]